MNNTLSKGLQILELLAQDRTGFGTRAIARKLGLGPSGAHRLLTTLLECGYVTQDPDTKRYALTLKLWTLGSRLVAKWDIKEIGAPHLRELADQTAETVHLSVLEDCDVLYVDKIDSRHPVRAYTQVGGRAPAHCVATGKALLAFTRGAEERLADKALTPSTEHTIVSHDALGKELAQIRRRGYALNFGEWRESVRGLAAPVYDSDEQVVCAVGISGPADRLLTQRLKEFAPIVRRVAQNMSFDMGMPVTSEILEQRG